MSGGVLAAAVDSTTCEHAARAIAKFGTTRWQHEATHGLSGEEV
jgi:hypothetical protein